MGNTADFDHSAIAGTFDDGNMFFLCRINGVGFLLFHRDAAAERSFDTLRARGGHHHLQFAAGATVYFLILHIVTS
jgi:hypothetical protein